MADKVKKPNVFRRLGNHFAKSWSELKKVSWPNFSTVLKNTAVVLVVVLAFLIMVGAFDLLFTWLIGLLR